MTHRNSSTTAPRVDSTFTREIPQPDFLKGPFKSDEAKENVRARRHPRERKPIDYERNCLEIQEYFQRRLKRLKVDPDHDHAARTDHRLDSN